MKNVNKWARPRIVDSPICELRGALLRKRTRLRDLATVLLFLSFAAVRLFAQSENASYRVPFRTRRRHISRV